MSNPQPGAIERYRERYASGDVPWDQTDPPPEVAELAATLAPGRALDLGCAYGRTSIYLARLGWHVDAVDFVDLAVAEAQARAEAAGVADRTCFRVADVTALDGFEGPYDLAVDIGCAHRFDAVLLAAYHTQVRRRLAPGAWFLLFGRLHEPARPSDDGPRWLEEPVLRDVFGRGFTLVRVERGITEVGDGAPWTSAWFWFRRADVP
jgi:cyclopropane fatty-acyl-phospholipid synthase-like methyltransferase